MKKHWLLLAFIVVIIVPGMILNKSQNKELVEPCTVEPLSVTEPSIVIKVKNGDKVVNMELEEYVLGVVLGEMPATFETEALKAQAVATRTYTLRRIRMQSKHGDADICTDSSCCQAFTDKKTYLLSKGMETDLEKVESAVNETAGQVLVYRGELIEATYFSCSGGMTEDAAAVWGTSIPYLESVASPGEEHANRYESTQVLNVDAFLTLLGIPPGTPVSNRDLSYTYTSGNGVEELFLLGTAITGTEVRKMLSLPSTAFSIEIEGDCVSITTKGNGHRVGMSQYGADAMAVNGSTYEEILDHYYRGTSVMHIWELS